jgi:photosystem II stability/assembly factor-like uncharacterized protein
LGSTKSPIGNLVRHILFLLISILFLSSPVIGQSEKPQTIVIPTGSLGEMSKVRIGILEKTLESKIADHFAIVPKELFEEAQEQAFQEMDSDECTEDQCIRMIQELLQVENSFKMDLMYEEGDTQISITWNDQDQKRVEEDYCEGCKTKGLRLMIGGLVEKLIGVKDVVKEEPPKKVEVELTGFFISVGNLCNILKSENGKDWEVVNNEGCKRLLGVTRGNNKLITVGISGTILSSEDGLDWYFDEIDTNNDLNEIYFHNNTFIIVGGDGIILVSQNGDSWEEVDSGVSDDLFDVTFFNGEFIVVGEDGTILVSSNGRNWEKVDSNTSNDLSGVTNSKKTIVTGGEDGIILHSKDNRNWSKSKKSRQRDIFGVYFENKLFFTVGKGGIQQSKNGKSWKSIKLNNNKFIRGLVYGNNKFVSVADHGTIFISDNGKKWEPVVSNTKWNIQEVNFFSN